MYKFTWLDASQRKDFQLRWWQVHRMMQKWTKAALPGQVHDIFANKKDLEKEITDLEDLSLAAFRAMKYLRQYVEANKTKDEENNSPRKNASCASPYCKKSLGGARHYVSGYNVFFCNSQCMAEFEQGYESEDYSR